MSEPTTEAGQRLLEQMPYWRNSAHHVSDEVIDHILAIEAEARASQPERIWRVLPDEDGEGGQTWEAAFIDCDMARVSLTLDVEAAKTKVMGWMTTTRGKQPDLWVPRSWVLKLLDELTREQTA